MDKKNIEFDDTRMEEYEFRQYKSHILINDRDINKIVVSNKIPFNKQDFKNIFGYKYAIKIKPLCIFHPRMSVYKKDFDKTKCMYFVIKDESFFDKYNEIWEKVSNIIKKK